MDLDGALAAHADWKIKLRAAIDNHDNIDVAKLSKDNCCAFGMWLHGEAKQKLAQFKAYPVCVEAHAGFHREAGKVGQLINQQKYEEARKALGVGSAYGTASAGVGVAIQRLKKESGL
jgi:methyl-accepting chemotaxis protein